jgi:hypothetical protein
LEVFLVYCLTRLVQHSELVTIFNSHTTVMKTFAVAAALAASAAAITPVTVKGNGMSQSDSL